MAQQTQRADSLQSVGIIGVIMGDMIHYFPRPIGMTAAPVTCSDVYALQVVIPPHTAIDPGAMLIVNPGIASPTGHRSQSGFGEEGFYIARSGKTGSIAWHSTPPSNAERVIWIRLP